MSMFLESVGLTVVFLFIIVYLLEALFYLKRWPFIKSTEAIRSLSASMPIVGHVWKLWGRPENTVSRAMKIFEQFQENNFKAWAVDRVYFFIVKPEDCALTLGSPEFLRKAPEYSVLGNSIMGEGIFSIDDMREWRTNRKLITPAFHFQILKSFIKNFHIEAKILAKNVWRKMMEDGEVEVHGLMGLCTLDMITKNAMDVSVQAQSNSSHVFVQGMKTVLHTWFTRITKPWLLNNTIFGFSSLKVEHDKAMRGVQSFAMGVILDKLEERHTKATSITPTTEQKPATPEEGSAPSEDDDAFCRSRNTRAFLDLLIDSSYDGVDAARMGRLIASLRQQKESQQEQKGFLAGMRQRFNKNNRVKEKMETKMDLKCEENCAEKSETDVELERVTCQLRDEVVTIMVGGQETTACENSFALLMLALHQDIQAKAITELEEIFGADSRSPTYDDLQKMVFLECVIKETMRLFPALPMMARVAQQRTVLSDNSVLPEGSTAVFFVLAMHRDPRLFPDPERFLPERFLPENSRQRHPYSFLPFGAGARNCIGPKYAMLQMKTILSTMLRDFKILPSKRVPNMESIKLSLTATLGSWSGCWIRLEERNSLDH